MLVDPKKNQKQKKVVEVKQQTKQQSKWNQLIKGILRPPRSQYKLSRLGERRFICSQNCFQRKQIEVSHNGKKIELTVYQNQKRNDWIILYLHGNSSSRAQCTTIINMLPKGFSIAAFDFMGCGMNYEEEFISLGVRQSQQVSTIVQYLSKRGFKTVLWGRSMGAATAIKYGKAPIIIADSAFKSFKGLCRQVAKRQAPKMLPNCIISCLFPCVFMKMRMDIQSKGRYDLQELDISEDIKKINPNTMMIFLSGSEDNLIDFRNSQKLYNLYIGQNKHIQIFPGNHNTKRPQQIVRKTMKMIKEHTEKLDNITSSQFIMPINEQHIIIS